MNWKSYSGHGGGTRGWGFYSSSRQNICAKHGCGEYATWRANIMLGKVATWIYSCGRHRKEWP